MIADICFIGNFRNRAVCHEHSTPYAHERLFLVIVHTARCPGA
jgi:hypothetical protein